jgi:hypothetical protein
MQLSKPPLFGYGLLLGLSPAASQSQSVYNLTLPINVANQGVLAMPGISFMDFGAFDVAGNLVFTDQGYLIVNRSRWGATSSDMGPPSIAEIRLHIRDSDPTDALWRGVIEFDAAEMAACIERPIRYFNEALPPLSTVKYNTANFPFRHNWLNGIVACLYEMAERRRQEQVPRIWRQGQREVGRFQAVDSSHEAVDECAECHPVQFFALLGRFLAQLIFGDSPWLCSLRTSRSNTRSWQGRTSASTPLSMATAKPRPARRACCSRSSPATSQQ